MLAAIHACGKAAGVMIHSSGIIMAALLIAMKRDITLECIVGSMVSITLNTSQISIGLILFGGRSARRSKSLKSGNAVEHRAGPRPAALEVGERVPIRAVEGAPVTVVADKGAPPPGVVDLQAVRLAPDAKANIIP